MQTAEVCWQLSYLSFDISADLSVLSGSFGQEAEHWSEPLFVVGALLGVTQTTNSSQAARAETLECPPVMRTWVI